MLLNTVIHGEVLSDAIILGGRLSITQHRRLGAEGRTPLQLQSRPGPRGDTP